MQGDVIYSIFKVILKIKSNCNLEVNSKKNIIFATYKIVK